MSLFPKVDSLYLDINDQGILSRMEDFYASAISINQSYWNEASIDNRFMAGDQSLWNELYGSWPMNRQKQFNFNRIRRVINLISGHQRRNRKSMIAVPVENADEQTSDQFTKILVWNTQQENILETISEAFQGSLVSGMNLLQVWVDYRSDPVSGNIKVDNCDYNSFLIDPYFRKPDLSDCNGLWKRTYLTRKEVQSLLPDESEIVADLNNYESSRGPVGNKFYYLPESFNPSIKNLLTYDEFYYKDYRKQRLLIDSQTGETLEWTADNEEGLRAYLQQYPQVTMIETEIPTVKLAIVVQGKVMYDGPNPLGIDKYPFIPVLAYYNPQIADFTLRVQGVVRGLRDAQFLYNRRRVVELDILESQVNSGWIYKENALVDPKAPFYTGQGRGIALKQEANIADVQRILPPDVPASMIQLSELLAREVMEISGVNEELIGSAVDDKAGILSMLRQGAGLTTLQVLFDQLDRSQKLLGKLLIDVVQANFTPGKVQRIIEEQPSPQFYNKAFGKYDCAVEDGLNTSTQRQMQFAQLLHLREVGVPISNEDLLECSTMQNKKKIIENANKAQQQAQQMQQAQAETTMAEQKARMDLAYKRAFVDETQGMKHLAEIDDIKHQAIEREAEAEKDREQALFNLVKALKEVEQLDLVSLEKLVALSQMVKANEAQSTAKSEEQPTIPKDLLPQTPEPAQLPEGMPAPQSSMSGPTGPRTSLSGLGASPSGPQS
jgi:hypothetical protein